MRTDSFTAESAESAEIMDREERQNGSGMEFQGGHADAALHFGAPRYTSAFSALSVVNHLFSSVLSVHLR
jgi:hypothetical protein